MSILGSLRERVDADVFSWRCRETMRGRAWKLAAFAALCKGAAATFPSTMETSVTDAGPLFDGKAPVTSFDAQS